MVGENRAPRVPNDREESEDNERKEINLVFKKERKNWKEADGREHQMSGWAGEPSDCGEGRKEEGKNMKKANAGWGLNA